MKINFKLKDAPEEYGIQNRNEISKIYEYIIKELNNSNIEIKNQHIKSYPEIDFPESVNINIVFVNGSESFNFYFDEDTALKTYGVFNITNGEGFLGEEYLAKDFTVLVDASKDSFDNTYKKYMSENKLDFIFRYMVTLTHEINHALEFIENSGGLTPYQVEDYFDSGIFDYSISDCCTGTNLPEYYKDFINITDEDEIYEIMEDRVEKKGREMLAKLNIPNDIFIKAVRSNKVKNKI